MIKYIKLKNEIFNLKADLVQTQQDLEREKDNTSYLHDKLYDYDIIIEQLKFYIDKEITECENSAKDFKKYDMEGYFVGKLSAYKKVLDRINELEDDYL